jgi:hypothetical protein
LITNLDRKEVISTKLVPKKKETKKKESLHKKLQTGTTKQVIFFGSFSFIEKKSGKPSKTPKMQLKTEKNAFKWRWGNRCAAAPGFR